MCVLVVNIFLRSVVKVLCVDRSGIVEDGFKHTM